MSIEAMKQALGALEAITRVSICDATHHSKKDRHLLCEECPNEVRHLNAITALRTAIEQAEKQDFRGARLVLTPDGVKQDGWMGDQPAASVQEPK